MTRRDILHRISPIALIIATLTGAPAFAVDILDTAANLFFDPKDSTKFSVELQLERPSSSLTERAISSRLAKALGKGTPFEVSRGTKALAVSIGPMKPTQLENLQEALSSFIAAIGLDEENGLNSVRVRVHLADSLEEVKAADVVNLIRNLASPDHVAQIRDHHAALHVGNPGSRSYSRGMLKRLFDPEYKPSLGTFLDDYFYRQGAEKRGIARAWSLPLAKVREEVLGLGTGGIIEGFHQAGLVGLTTLFMEMRQDSELAQRFKRLGVTGSPATLEFRLSAPGLDITSPVRQALGLVALSRKHGFVDGDLLLSEYSGVEVKSIKEIRKKVNERSREGKLIVRYLPLDPSADADDKADWLRALRKFYKGKDQVLIFLNPHVAGRKPLVIPGESVVLHNITQHATSIVGKHNPGLVNGFVSDVLANKWAEYKFAEEYAPGAMPETVKLSQLVGPKIPTIMHGGREIADTRKLSSLLQQKFPYGWVLKPSWGFGAETAIITHQTDMTERLEEYLDDDFDQFYREVKPYFVNDDPQVFDAYLKENHDDYLGWKIGRMLAKSPDQLIVQEWMPIRYEFRVEVHGGKVLGGRSTVDRYGYDHLNDEYYVAPPKELFQEVEAYVQGIFDGFPPELRETPAAGDALVSYAKGEDGKPILKMVEFNFGANSGFISIMDEAPNGILAMGKFLARYPDLIASGELNGGMPPREQILWLKRKLKDWGVDPVRDLDGLIFTEDQVIDTDYGQRKAVDRKFKAKLTRKRLNECLDALAAPVIRPSGSRK